MPSHVYVQLGMWERVAASNRDASKAGVDRIERLKLAVTPALFHPLSWLAYANLMLGRFADAADNLTTAQQLADGNRDNRLIRLSLLGMRARHIIETDRWTEIEPEQIAAAVDDAEYGASASVVGGLTSRAGWAFVVGVTAAKRKDWMTVERIETLFRSMHADLLRAGQPDWAKGVEIVQREFSAISLRERGQLDEALRAAKDAADAEQLTVPLGHGPPQVPMKPALELYGEVLLDANRPTDAIVFFEQSLLRTPKRTPSLLGLARAAARSGNIAMARQYADIVRTPGASHDSAAFREARKFVSDHAPEIAR